MERNLRSWVRTAILCIVYVVAHVVTAAPVHTTYLWHLEQPIYWPDTTNTYNGYEVARESILRRNAGAFHPQNDVAGIFSVADRVAAYQFRTADAIAQMSGADAGAQVTYTGCLVRNVASLGAYNMLGYSPSWNSSISNARTWNTSGNFPRLEMVVIPYHHALSPLVDREVLKKEIQIYQYLYPFVWGSGEAISTGFFPPELAFSERIIPALAECGVSWTFVPSNHLSRACQNFPLILGSGGENCNPPNRADQVNPNSANWFAMTISRGCTPTDAVPFSYQLHRARYVDPESGAFDEVIVVPVAMGMSWQDGYQTYGIGDINAVAPHNDPAHPMLITLGHDGDNAFGGGYSYYMESVPGFTQQAVNAGYEPTTVPEFLADHPPAANDIVHVEDGAWVNADGDFGDPDFINWNWPPYNASGQRDIPNGWAVDIRNWAIITAATNFVLTAEAIYGPLSLGAIQDPQINPANSAELAWHFLLGALNSGYMYYGGSLDMEVKATVACNHAVNHALNAIGGATDVIPPTIWALQQWPHNPGATGFGPVYGYQATQNARDFFVWTFIADYSGVETATLYYRLDGDGNNPLSSHQNETFAGGSEVGTWYERAMTRRAFPAGDIYNESEIDFDYMPLEIAEQFYYHVSDSTIVDSGGVLVDYYVEAIDSLGNTKRSDIYHTFVGTGEGSSTPGDRVAWTPLNPEGGDTLRIEYNLTNSPLPPNTNPVYIHIGHSGWQNILNPDPAMSDDSAGARWIFNYAIPLTATAVDFVFRSGANQWDNNNGQDWHVTVAPAGGNFVMDGTLDASAQPVAVNGGVSLWAAFNGATLYLASQRAHGSNQDKFIFLAAPPGNLVAAPWAKAGQVAAWSAYLAEESSNGWRGWFDAAGATSSAIGAILESTIELSGEFGGIPDQVWACAASYVTSDGGALVGQAPAPVVSNGSIESGEWIPLRLKPTQLTITRSGPSVILRWLPVFGAVQYKLYRAQASGAAETLLSTTATAEYSDSDGGDRAFYRVAAVFP